MSRFVVEDDSFVDSNFIGTQKVSGRITNENPFDLYQISIRFSGSFNLKLDGMSNDADLHVYRDTNKNSKIDLGSDVLVAKSVNGGFTPEELNLSRLEAGEYLIQVKQYSGETDYKFTAHVDGFYTYTRHYGNGEYFKGSGYVAVGELYYEGQKILDGGNAYTVFDSMDNVNLTSTDLRGDVWVWEYYDANYRNSDGTLGALADGNPNGGALGHLHPFPYDASVPAHTLRYEGVGNDGLFSVKGLIHLDGHRLGFPTSGDAQFGFYKQAEMGACPC